jgi:PhnB protein
MNETPDNVQAAPRGWHTVTPRIVVHNAQGLVEFLCYAFGARGAYDRGSPSIVMIGDSRLMISETGTRGPKHAFLYVYLSDPDTAYHRALEHGAKSVEAPFETPYGDRRCMIEDRWGNTWQIAVHKGFDHEA